MGCLYNSTLKYAYTYFKDFMEKQKDQKIDPKSISWASMEYEIYKFVIGFHDNWENQPWNQCDEIYGIENISNLHWAAYSYNFAAKEVRVYDSLMNILKNQREEVFNVHATLAPSFYNEIVNFDVEKLDPTVPFTIKYIDVPQQPNSADCGVYSIKFAQCLAMAADISKLNTKAFQEYRMNLAVDIVKWVKENNQNFGYEEKDIKI